MNMMMQGNTASFFKFNKTECWFVAVGVVTGTAGSKMVGWIVVDLLLGLRGWAFWGLGPVSWRGSGGWGTPVGAIS